MSLYGEQKVNDGTGKYYVSLYEKYPIYESAEGGYYYAGCKYEGSLEFNNFRKARKAMKKYLKEFKQDCNDNGYTYNYCPVLSYVNGVGKYIGEGFFMQIERTKGISKCGYTPYC